MGYAIMRATKMKSQTEINDRYNHDERIFNVTNADPARTPLNEYPVNQLHGRSYYDIYEDTVRMYQMKGTMGTVRKDAVKGIDVFLSFSHADIEKIDINEWVNANVKWLRKEFNPPGGKIHYTDREGNYVTEDVDNVKSVIVHMDEVTPHIHAFIIPIDENGRLNAKKVYGDRNAMIEKQDSYAKAMEKFGLQRGERHSVARHEKTSEYYRRLEKAVDTTLPEPKRGETINEYKARVEDFVKTMAVHHNDELVKKDRENVKSISSLVTSMEGDLKELRAEQKQNANEKAEFETEFKELASVLGVDELSVRDIRTAANLIKEQKTFREAIDTYPDNEKAREIENLYEYMVKWQNGKKRTQTIGFCKDDLKRVNYPGP